MIFEFVGKLVWPATVMAIVLIFRKRLLEIIPKIRNVKAGNIEVIIEAAKAKAEETSEIAIRQVLSENVQKMIFQDEGQDVVPQQSNSNGESTMLAFAAGRSFDQNQKYKIYYDPANRNHALPFQYIGLYKDWQVRSIGRVSKIVYCNLEDDILVGTKGYDITRLTPGEYSRIKEIIEETKYYDIDEGCKFFLVEQFYETHLICESPIRGKQYFWLNEIEGFKPHMSTKEIAELLWDRSLVQE